MDLDNKQKLSEGLENKQKISKDPGNNQTISMGHADCLRDPTRLRAERWR